MKRIFLKSQSDSRHFSYSQLLAFEEYMFLDQKLGLPMTQEMIWIFAGTVEPQIFEDALRTVVAAEPLYGATVRRRFGAFGRRRWAIPSVAPLNFSQVDVERDFFDETSGFVQLSTLDLKTTGGFRIRLERGPKSFRLLTSVHHSICDGIGLTKFLGRLFDVYERRLNGDVVEQNRLACREIFFKRDRKRRRDAPKRPSTNFSEFTLNRCDADSSDAYSSKTTFSEPAPFNGLSRLTAVRFIVSEVVKWFWRRPVSLTKSLRRDAFRNVATRREIAAQKNPRSPFFAASQLVEFQDFVETIQNSDADASTPTLYWRVLPPTFFDVYRRRARARNVGVNAALLRDLFLALKSWSQKEFDVERSASNRYFRVLLPTNLRRDDERRVPLVNRLGFAFLDGKPSKIQANSLFLQELNSTLKSIRQYASGAIFLEGARFFQKIPGALSLLTSRFFCHCTVVFSNIGVPCKALEQKRFRDAGTIEIPGRLKMIRVVGAPPVRTNTPLSIGLASRGDETVLAFCLDAKRFPPEHFLSFFQEFSRQLVQSDDDANAESSSENEDAV